MFRFNREGYVTIVIATLIAVLLMTAVVAAFKAFGLYEWLMWLLLTGLFVVLILVIFFFRDPKRNHITDDSMVFSGADGEVVAIEEVEESEFLKERTIQISVFMSITNVHKNWYPVGGKIIYCKYHPGRFIVAWKPKSSDLNEHVSVVIDTGKNKVLFRQIAGYVARRIVSYANEGAEVVQNTKCGFIKFGSRFDVFIPVDSEILVSIGQKVKGGQTPLAKI